MANDLAKRFPLLTGRVESAERYVSVRRGGRPAKLPQTDPAKQHAYLSKQLDAIWERVAKRERDDRDPGAMHEIIAIEPKEGAQLEAESFGDKRLGMRVIAKDDKTGVVYVDASRPDLPHLRRKVDAFADEKQVNEKTGARRSEQAIAPIQEVRLATFQELIGPRLAGAIERGDINTESIYWVELGCRGGQRERTLETERSRGQIRRAMEQFQRGEPVEFLAPEQIVFFVRLKLDELKMLVARVDCVYEMDLAPAAVRDWLLFEQAHYPIPDLSNFRVTAPPAHAASVVVLDTGVATQHPLLRDALRSAYSVVPNNDQVEDRNGHGTEMAGVALYDDVGRVVEDNGGVADHWVESVKILDGPGQGSAADENFPIWPVITKQAVEIVETDVRQRVFAMSVTAPTEDPEEATTWSQAVDQLAFNGGRGRLICVSIGNCKAEDEMLLAQNYPQLQLHHKLEQPAQAVNAVTIGAYTTKTTVAPDSSRNGLVPLAPEGGVCLSTRTGCLSNPIKPDVMFEGGNVLFDGVRGWRGEATLTTLTTGRDVFQRPLVVCADTSAANLHGARFAAMIASRHPRFRPETVRGLMIHSARWTETMKRQFRNKDERLTACGYGVPEPSRATECMRTRATIVVEDSMANAVSVIGADGEETLQRVVKFVRLPVPEEALLSLGEELVELSVTLSFFAEPSTKRRRESLGLRMAWDVQGPTETESEFKQRINDHARDEAKAQNSYARTSGFTGWEIGWERRSRGTVQSDRITVPASFLAEDKLIGVYPVLGWWDDRNDTREESMAFSLIVTIEAPNIDVYTPVAQAISAVVEV